MRERSHSPARMRYLSATAVRRRCTSVPRGQARRSQHHRRSKWERQVPSLKGTVWVLAPTKGKAILSLSDAAEKDIIVTPPERTSRLGVSYVPEFADVFPTLSIRKPHSGGARKRREHAARLERVYSVFPDPHAAERATDHTLSGGQRMTLALGRAPMGEPEVASWTSRWPNCRHGTGKSLQHLVRLRDTGVGMLVVRAEYARGANSRQSRIRPVSGEVRS